MRRVVLPILLCLLLVPVGLSPAAATAAPASQCVVSSNQDNINEGPTDYSWNLRPQGSLRGVMLFVDFPNATSGEPTSNLYDLLVPEAVDYFQKVSYGQMTLSVDTPIDSWLRMPEASSNYDTRTFSEQRKLLADAVAAANPNVDFSPYDLVYIATPRVGTGLSLSPAILYRVGSGVTADGNELRFGATFGEDVDRGFIVLVHETSHAFGAPDLYDFAAIANGTNFHHYVGAWDPMGQIEGRTELTTWHRFKFGWLNDDQIACINQPAHEQFTLTPAETIGGLKTVIVRTSASTAFVIENRQPIDYDANLCDKGILIYKVDGNAETGYGPMVVQRAQETSSDYFCESNPDIEQETALAAFDLGTGEVSSYDNSNAQLTVELLSTDGTSYTVDVDFGGPGYVPGPETHKRNVIVTHMTRRLVLKGVVQTVDGFSNCSRSVPVKLEKKKGARWATIRSGSTTLVGGFSLKIPTPSGSYRVKAPKVSKGALDICAAARSESVRFS